MAAKRTKPATSRPKRSDAAIPSLFRALEALLEHSFCDPALLQLALTHRSHTYESRHGDPAPDAPFYEYKYQKNAPGTDNEQLEFLGDAILGLCVAEALFKEFPQCTEGELTRMRSALVSRARLAQLGAALGLGQLLLLGKSAEHNAGRAKPALLANAAEAVIAAVYLDAAANGDSGMAPVCHIVEHYLLGPERANLRQALAESPRRGALRDPKTLLQERVQARVQALAHTAPDPSATADAATTPAPARLRYVDIAMTGLPHQRVFTVEARLEEAHGTRVLATAEGPSKKEAQQRAAELALASWDTFLQGAA
jgi:ribonuclease-3